MLVGGPSQLETWDPKPDAPREIRGPFGSIATRVPGVRISEHLPRLACADGSPGLVRSVHHEAAPIHADRASASANRAALPTGRGAPAHWSRGVAVARTRSPLPPFVIIPGPIDNTGVQVPTVNRPVGGCGYEPFHLAGDPASPGWDPRSRVWIWVVDRFCKPVG